MNQLNALSNRVEYDGTSLKEVAQDQAMTLSKLIASIDAQRVAGANLSSAIRVYILERFRTQLQGLEPGAGHGANVGPPALTPSGQ